MINKKIKIQMPLKLMGSAYQHVYLDHLILLRLLVGEESIPPIYRKNFIIGKLNAPNKVKIAAARAPL